MIKEYLKKISRSFGYDIVNQKTFGLDILNDLTALVNAEDDILIFDIGANEGDTSDEFLRQFPKARIFSFEPDPDVYASLNKRFTPYNNVKTFNFGFGNDNQVRDLNINQTSGGNSFLNVSDNIQTFAKGGWTEPVGKVKAEIKKLNDFCYTHNISTLDIVKIDTQGYEKLILEGGDRFLNAKHTKIIYIEVLFVELYENQVFFPEIYALLTSRGFRLTGLYNKFYKVEKPHYLLWCDALFVSDSI